MPDAQLVLARVQALEAESAIAGDLAVQRDGRRIAFRRSEAHPRPILGSAATLARRTALRGFEAHPSARDHAAGAGRSHGAGELVGRKLHIQGGRTGHVHMELAAGVGGDGVRPVRDARRHIPAHVVRLRVQDGLRPILGHHGQADAGERAALGGDNAG